MWMGSVFLWLYTGRTRLSYLNLKLNIFYWDVQVKNTSDLKIVGHSFSLWNTTAELQGLDWNPRFIRWIFSVIFSRPETRNMSHLSLDRMSLVNRMSGNSSWLTTEDVTSEFNRYLDNFQFRDGVVSLFNSSSVRDASVLPKWRDWYSLWRYTK